MLELIVLHDSLLTCTMFSCSWSDIYEFFFFQAEDGIRDLVRSRGLGDVYKRQRANAAAAGIITLGYVRADGQLSFLQRVGSANHQGLSLIHI